MSDLINRHVFDIALDITGHCPALIIDGARQVGKSTLAQQLAADSNAVITSLVDEQTRAAAAQDPVGFFEQAGNGTLVIDELQRLPQLAHSLGPAIERDARPGRFIITQSAATLSGIGDRLAGKVMRLPLYGFSQGEVRGYPDDFVAQVTSLAPAAFAHYSTTAIRADYAALVARGSYPAVQALPERVRGQWFDSYAAEIVHDDLAELNRELDPGRAQALLQAIAQHQAGELVKARMSKASLIPESTITRYITLLDDVGLVRSIPAWTPGLTPREVGRRKVFITDSGLAARLAHLTGSHLSMFGHSQELRSMLEGFVAAELLRQQVWTSQEFGLRHFRDRSGPQVDLIAEVSGGGVIALQVRSAASYLNSHFDGLRFLREKLGDRFLAGIVLTAAPHGYRYADRLYGLPIDAIWNL